MTVVDLLVVNGAAVVVVVVLLVVLLVVVVVVVVSEMRAIVIDYHEAFGQPRHGPSGLHLHLYVPHTYFANNFKIAR